MELQQLHGSLCPQQDCQLDARIRWKDPTARSRWRSYQHSNRQSHRYDFQLLQLSAHLLVLEGGQSPSTPAGFLLQCRWQPGWCESVSFFYFFLCNLDFLTNVWPNVANSSKTHFHQMVLETDLSAGEAVTVPPPGDDENLIISVDSH